MLKYLQVVVEIYPDLVADEYRPFLCGYNDPLYIKIEKMKLMYNLSNEQNGRTMINEFYEYHKEFNVDFVRIAIKYIYRIGLKIKSEAPHAILTYKKILENEVILPEILGDIAEGAACIVRAFPKVRGGTDIVKLLSKNYKNLHTQESKVAFIWMLGEYCEKVSDSGKLLEHFSGSFFSQTSSVQLQILNSGIKMYLNGIDPIDTVLQELLQKINDQSNNPDLRDRGYIYWRLLYSDPSTASKVIFSEVPPTEIEVEDIDLKTKMILLRRGGSISNIIGVPLETIFTKKRELVNRGEVDLDTEVVSERQDDDETQAQQVNNLGDDEETEEDSKPTNNDGEFDLLGMDTQPAESLDNNPTKFFAPPSPKKNNDEFDLLGGGATTPQKANVNQNEDDDEEDLFGDAAKVDPSIVRLVQMPEEVEDV